MPGIFLLINIIVTLYLFIVLFIPDSNKILNIILSIINSPVLGITLLIVFGYPLGVVLRLLKNEKIDQRSAKYIKLLKPKYRNEDFLNDHFFYNNWMYKKSLNRLPKAVGDFYKDYWNDKYLDDGIINTAFINFCKTIILKFDPQCCNEIYAAEALSRFVAGSYYSLQTSIFLMIINSFLLNKILSLQASFIAIFLILGYSFLLHVILSQYRFLRCKEVDTIFNACFANREHFENLFPDFISRHTSDTKV
jgi:hypothetical protein